MRLLKPDLRRWPRPTVPSVREKRAYYKLLAGATDYHLSMVDGTAFAWVPGIDLSFYAGQTGSNTPYFLTITDSAGKVARGYVAAAGAGETLGGEVLTNPSFDVNTNTWVATNGTIASVAGGQSNNCCELTRVGASPQYFNNTPTFAWTIGTLYKMSGYVKSGTSGNEATELRAYSSGMGLAATVTGTTTAAWVQLSDYGTSEAATGTMYTYKNTVTAGTMLFDEFSVKPLTDCPATAVRIVSTNDGGTQNWADVEVGFEPNDATYTVVVQHAGAY